MIKFDEQKFLSIYRGIEPFLTKERKYLNLFLKLLEDEELLKHIKFANDVLEIPPIRTFITYHRDYLKEDVFNTPMSAIAKRGLGACFGYLYKNIYFEKYGEKYDSVQTWFNDKEKTKIKTASYFIKEEK